MALVSGAIAAYQMIDGMKRLNAMEDRPEIGVASETKDWASTLKARTGYGLSSSQRDSVWNDINRGENASFRRAMSVGNGQSSAIMASLNANNLRARMGVGKLDADLQQQHVRDYTPMVGQLQQVRTMNDRSKIGDWDRRAQAYGEEVKMGMQNASQTEQNEESNVSNFFGGMMKMGG